jgi:hypothetical protein
VQYLGYVTDTSRGQTTINFKATNNCKPNMTYVAIGTDSFTRVAPANGSVYTGSLGTYNVSWTSANGNPGFVSIKFVPTFTTFNNGAMDVFKIVVSGFNPNTTVQVQGKAAGTTDTFSFRLSTSCPASPLAVKARTGGLSERLSGSWNRLLSWLAPRPTAPAMELGRPGYFAPDFSARDDHLLALSRDGTLNWRWLKESSN